MYDVCLLDIALKGVLKYVTVTIVGSRDFNGTVTLFATINIFWSWQEFTMSMIQETAVVGSNYGSLI